MNYIFEEEIFRRLNRLSNLFLFFNTWAETCGRELQRQQVRVLQYLCNVEHGALNRTVSGNVVDPGNLRRTMRM